MNLRKTKLLGFFSTQKKVEVVVLSINGILIEQLTLDNKVTWNSHKANIKTKVSKNISVLNKAKYVLDYKAMRILYCSLIFPYFSYCFEVWGNQYMSNIKPLFVLQKRAVGNIHNLDYREFINGLFIKSGFLKFKDLVQLQTLLVMYKAKSTILPELLQKLFCFRGQGPQEDI